MSRQKKKKNFKNYIFGIIPVRRPHKNIFFQKYPMSCTLDIDFATTYFIILSTYLYFFIYYPTIDSSSQFI